MSAIAARSGSLRDVVLAHRRLILWLVVGACFVLDVIAVVLGFSARAGAQPIQVQGPIAFLGSVVVTVGYAFVFVLLVTRVGENAVGWLFGGVALLSAFSNTTWAYVTYSAETIPARLPATELMGLFGALSVPVWPIVFVLLALVFPDGRFLTPAWRWLALAAVAVAVLSALAIALGGGPMPIWQMTSPTALPGAAGAVLTPFASGLPLLGVLLFGLALGSLAMRYQRADPIGRLQLKWLLYSLAVFAVVAILFFIVSGSAFRPGSATSDLVWLAFCGAATLVPIAASIAILRYHLYEIETIISRTLVYGLLTAILAGMYTAGIRLFNVIFVETTGERSDLALVITTLVLATTFTPIKAWLEAKVAARKGVIADPARSPQPSQSSIASATTADDRTATDLTTNDEAVERIAERAAEIVLRRLGRDGTSASQAPAGAPPPSPQPGRATLE